MLIIRLPDGGQFEVPRETHLTVGRLKALLAGIIGLPTTCQELVFDGAFLKDATVLDHYDITSTRPLELVLINRA